MPAVVYSITHRATGREYIGVTSRDVETRWREHLTDARRGRGAFLHRALRKHGDGAFDFKMRAALPTIQEAWLAERILVACERPVFNLTVGGEGSPGWRHDAETRARISEALRASEALKAANRLNGLRKRGRAFTVQHKQALKNAHVGFTGRKHSAEARARMSEAAKLRVAKGKATCR